MQNRFSLLAIATVALACGKAPEQDKIVEAFTVENEQAKLAEELDAKDAERRRIEAEAHRKEEAAMRAAIEQAAAQPAEAPADLEQACDLVVEAYDTFMKTGSENDALRWSDGRRRKMGERRAACIKVGQIAVAACEARALQAAPEELDPLPRTEAARRLMERCHEEFGAG